MSSGDSLNECGRETRHRGAAGKGFPPRTAPTARPGWSEAAAAIWSLPSGRTVESIRLECVRGSITGLEKVREKLSTPGTGFSKV